MKAVTARITGRVQGVWYRAWTAKTAEEMGLSGWVRNEPDGAVTALFAGQEPAVERMLEACRDGPMAARVERVETSPADPPAEPGFRVVG